MNVPELVELMVFSDKVRLEVLILMDMNMEDRSNGMKSLRKKAENWIKP